MPYLIPEDKHDRTLLQRFGVELRRCRLASGLSQVALAERARVSQSTISRLENGRAPAASVLKLVRLGDTLGSFFPLGFCPHTHHCSWVRLLEDGRVDSRHEPVVAEDFLGSFLDPD